MQPTVTIKRLGWLAAATIVLGVLIGVGAGLLTLLLYGVEHVLLGYIEGPELPGPFGVPAARRAISVTVGLSIAGIIWYLVGLLWCLTIIGIPVGLQCFKLGRLSFFPFGKDVALSGETTSLLLNIFWLIFGGIELAITHAVFAVILCCTIIGIPFGMQHFKLAKLALLPFGAQITDK